MPFVSERQRRFMFANHPDIAKRWAHEGKRGRKRKHHHRSKRRVKGRRR